MHVSHSTHTGDRNQKQFTHRNQKQFTDPREKQFGDRKEKMTDVNIAVQAIKDVLAIKPAGIALVSGDRDFMPVVEFAAKANVPVAMFFPQEHDLHRLAPGVTYSNRVTITYLTREMLQSCRLSDVKWIDYLKLKVRDHPKFDRCLKFELGLSGEKMMVAKSGNRR